MSKFALVGYSETSSPPNNGLKLGMQTDGAGDLWVAVADTEWGTIPGKANGSGKCWYSYGGTEYYIQDNFAYVTSTRPTKLEPNKGSPPQYAVLCGFQTDSAGYLYAAIADTEWGTIPGKAQNGTCWYPYGGAEYTTENFSWVVLN